MRLCLFEDGVEALEPLSLTRPVFELRCGLTSLAQKQARYLALPIAGVCIRPLLEELQRQQNPTWSVNEPGVFASEDIILVNGRWLPPDDAFSPPVRSCVGMVGDSVAYVVLRTSEKQVLSWERLSEMLDHWQQSLAARPAGGSMISHPWDLVDRNGAEIRRDFAWLDPIRENPDRPGLMVAGPLGQLWIAPEARIEPLVFADTTHGPVVIDDGALVTAFSRLEGPCHIGPGTQVMGAKIRAGTSLGAHCRVGGEVEASILHGYSNKYHDGFLGHAYIGEWVNLGAGTHNSDLRNDYGDVVVPQRGLKINTGMSKVGCFLGDHTKTGLGTLLNTGTNVGAFCSLLPAGRFAPKYLPSFTSWWNGSLTEAFTLEQLLITAEIVMRRRGVALTAAHRALYANLFDDTAQERRRVLRESEQRLLRKSA
ncbi:MAG: hypothetical protein HYX68_19320 [Planctomycetes bacterium]|nr:hypothetical protein [Planctomycetota bacterium]